MKNPSSGMGVFGVAAIGIGGMVGGGIFAVLGTAVQKAGGGTPVAFLVAGLIAALTAYSYAKLSVKYPSSGGTVVFLHRAFGVDLMTGSLNLMLWLSYLVTIALYAAAFASYGLTFFAESTESMRHVLITVGILLPASINLVNASLVSKSETVIVVLKLALLAIVIIAGISGVDSTRLAVTTWSTPLSLIVAGMTIFVAYEGFELIANAAEDVRDPEKTLPRAFALSVGFVILLYILIAIVTVGSVDQETIVKAKDYALAAAAKPALGQAGFVLVSVSALLATFSAINATIYGNARLGYTLAKDGELPAPVGETKKGQPVAGVLLTMGLSMLLANLVDLDSIAILGSASFLLIFAFVNASAVKLSSQTGAIKLIPILGTLACLLALTALLWDTGQNQPQAVWVFVGMVLVSIGFEFVYSKTNGRKLNLGDAN